ncbi:MAG: Fe-S protein assembly co-chaperone HscB [gamma proteobacterium symbiont of Bathyaustriella thionipta]|nr:Fe-S protein assembly co-chaperone HscB [gamma proteobacterium symbiont of Bathyaustriella thionipta]
MLDFSQNYFEMLSLPLSYDVDLNRLAQHYRNLQRVVHPDRFASASEQEKRLSMQAVTLLNEAYSVLKDPLKRAFYLLQLKGIHSGAEHKTSGDAAFLMQQMELREKLESIHDTPDAWADLSSLMNEIESLFAALSDEFKALMAEPDEEKLQQAEQVVLKMQFVDKLRHEAEETEAKLENNR